MKRELAFALQTQCELTAGLGRTRASKVGTQSFDSNNGVPEGRTRKRFKTSGANESESNGEIGIDHNQDKTGRNLVVPMAVNETNELKNAEINVANNDLKSLALVELPRRFTRSVLSSKPEVDPVQGSAVAAASDSGILCDGKNGTVLSAEARESSVVCATGSETKKLEMKMSKKIALRSRPSTTKELFSTGLLEGCPVFYNGGDKGSALRGMIKDTGILCYCSLCKGSRVVNPCQFEIHACNSYRRAAQYICLENGKSLLEVVKVCRNSPLDMLEETIRSVIGPLSEKESIICQNCKGSFPETFAANTERLCPSCVGVNNLEAATTHPIDTNTGSLQPVLDLRRTTRSATATVSLQDRKQERESNDSSPRPPSVPKSTGSASVRRSLKTNNQEKTTKRLAKPVSARKSNRSASVRSSSQHKSQSNSTKESSKAILLPRPSKTATTHLSPLEKSKWKITKKDQGLHKLVFEGGGLPDGTEVAYYSRGKRLLEGYKMGPGIFCRCCNSEVSPSQFEAHAGWASRKKPYQYIYTSNGVSLHEFAISLLKGRKHSVKYNDDLCIICADGGNLLLCDVCPRAFHIECASLTSIPRGKWYCQYCQNMFQREKFVEYNANAVAAGRVCGVDPIEEITRRCIRIVKNPEDAEVIACVLCRSYNFRKSGFGPFTVIVCDQCEKEYHVGCLKKHQMADLKELPKGKWFCCMDCGRIYSALQNLLILGEEKIPDTLLDVIKKKHEHKVSDIPADLDVRWRVLNGKIASPENRLFLSKAVAIFHECFDPIVDSATGRDFIPAMVYGRNIRGQDFGGMYCAVLTLNSRVVSAGIFRVFGQEIAELPLVATSNDNQGKGYFQILFSCIEKLLAFLKVKWLVLPAASEAEAIWTQKFGFEKIPLEQLSNFRKTCWQMLTFTGTSMLQKTVPPCRIIEQEVVNDDVSKEPSGVQ